LVENEEEEEDGESKRCIKGRRDGRDGQLEEGFSKSTYNLYSFHTHNHMFNKLWKKDCHKTFKCSLSSLLLIFSLQLKISIGMRDNCIQEMNNIKTPISVTYWHVNNAMTTNPQNKAKNTKEKIP